ncbi:histidine phosphatase family protein [Variovorax paradoxus]|nr:histidine phosphatase family protein [Variovorax paradoxus]MBT2301906.1 histidine phosphatase family protein [Variovorax paradoxus]
MKRLLLIRHGLPHEGHPGQPHDPPLHLLGRRHAQRLARQLAADGIDRIVCSPQQRAIDTAMPLARKLGLTPEIHDGLAEVDHGTGRYRSVDTLRAEGPERWAEFVASPARFFGKDPAEYEANVLQTFESIVADTRGARIAVFSHGMTIKTILCAALGVREGLFGRFTIAHCSVSRLSGRALSDMRVDSVNESLCKPAPASAQ